MAANIFIKNFGGVKIMQCRRCGKELGDNMRCGFCGYDNVEGNLRELTRTEKNFFNGVTIDAGTSGEHSYRGQSSSYNFGGSGFRGTFINVGHSGFFDKIFSGLLGGLLNNNTLTKIAVALIFLAFAVLFFFVALPVIFVILAVGIAIYVFSNFIKS